MSTVKVTGEEEPGKRFPVIVACSVTDELEPTVAEPVPEPLDVKYATAAPVTARAHAQPSTTNARFLVIQRISFPFFVNLDQSRMTQCPAHRRQGDSPLDVNWQSEFPVLYKLYNGHNWSTHPLLVPFPAYDGHFDTVPLT